MRAGKWAIGQIRGGLGLWVLVCLGGVCVGAASAATPTDAGKGKGQDAKAEAIARGRAIFLHEWMPKDPWSHGGDGLGPVYNDSSCVACHNMGAPGGGGPVSKNIDILNAFRNNGVPQGNNAIVLTTNGPVSATGAGPGTPSTKPDLKPLTRLHAGFRTSRTVVLHRFGTDPNYEAWRQALIAMNPALIPALAITAAAPDAPQEGAVVAQLTNFIPLQQQVQVFQTAGAVTFDPQQSPGSGNTDAFSLARQGVGAGPGSGQRMQVGEFSVLRSQRNPSALFGLGQLDALPEKAIEEAANRTFPDFPEIRGRVSRLKDGRIGRLGWKGQTANVDDFVLNACANEVGLEVPGHAQAIVPQAPSYKPTGLDLTRAECDDLAEYVRSLPAPQRRKPASSQEARVIHEGQRLFESVGCATCHLPKLGSVEGLFSDLLLHDMGNELADTGSYGDTTDPSDDGEMEPLEPVAQAGPGNAQPQAKPLRGATRQEWRTPPLWGFRDSGPYLHDGRAQTLEQAIALHGGQASRPAQKYFALTPKERQKVETFLKSLVAPTPELAQAN